MKNSMDLSMNRSKIFCFAGALFLCALFFISLFIGKYPLSLNLLLAGDSMQWTVFWNLRFTRVLVGCIGGMAIGISGFVYQMLFKNPLASPDILGVSSGASAGAAMGILFFSSVYSVILCSFLGGIISVILAILFASVDPGQSKITVVLSGIAVHAVSQMILMILKLMADPEKELASIEYWIMGGLNGIRADIMWINITLCLLTLVLLLLLHRHAIMLSMDEIEAKMLGVKVVKMRVLLLLVATLSVASIVSMTGIISFVGLLAPHFARNLTKNNKIETMYLSGVLGGIFLVVADLMARSIAKTELPVSIFTSMLGVPFLVLLILRGRERL